MPKITYVPKNFAPATMAIIKQAEAICIDYARRGFTLTLRQLYYQFVSKALIPNKDTEYKRLGSIINDARLAGLIDWYHLEDRTRNLRSLSHWDNPADIIDSAAYGYRTDKWATQPHRVECFPPETPVIAVDGITAIAALEAGDSVLVDDGTFETIERVTSHPYDGELIAVDAVGLLPFRCTPNHLIMVRPRDDTRPSYKGKDRKFGVTGWVPAGALRQFDLLRVPRLKGVKLMQGFFMNGGPRSTPVYAPMTADLCRVIGLYLAEGSIRPDNRTTQFTFGAHEQEYAAVICTWAKSVGLSTHCVSGPGTLIVYAFGRALADWLTHNFGTGSHHKKLPAWFLTLPEQEQLMTVAYWVRGDGHWNAPNSVIVATTRSAALAQQMQLVLVRCGYPPSLRTTMDHGAPRYGVAISGLYGATLAARWGLSLPPKGLGRSRRYNHIRLDDDYAYYPVRATTRAPFSGTVHNLEIARLHTYCMPVSVHNCWIEKDALVGVIQGVCNRLDVPYFSCRGYTSQSEVWGAAQRLQHYLDKDQTPTILHLGDHDPSGIDMTRDITDRLTLFMGGVPVDRLALNFDQVEHYHPPPNPTKLTDSRAVQYLRLHGDESWELDALEPEVISQLIEDAVYSLRDADAWELALQEEENQKQILTATAKRWEDVTKFLLEGS